MREAFIKEHKAQLEAIREKYGMLPPLVLVRRFGISLRLAKEVSMSDNYTYVA